MTPPSNGRRDTQPHWKTLLDAARQEMTPQKHNDTEIRPTWPTDRRLVYIVDVPQTTHAPGLALELATEKRTVSGGWEPPVPFRLGAGVWLANPDPVDRQIAQMLLGAVPPTSHDRRDRDDRTSGFVLRGAALDITLRMICDTGRCHVRMTHADRPVYPVRWDDGPAWHLQLRVAHQRTNCYSVTAFLERGGQEMPLSEPAILHSEGFLLARGVLGRFDHSGAYALVTLFREQSSIVIGESELPALLESLYAVPRLPPIEFPPDTGLSEVHAAPLPCVTIFPDPNDSRGTHHRLEPGFIYGKTRISGQESSNSVFDRDAVAIRYRDFEFEAASRDRLVTLGAREEWVQGANERCLTISQGRLGEMIAELVRSGWRVDADGAAYRSAGATRAMVRSGIDWFELDAGVTYGDVEVPLHDLLEARRAGETTIALSDGTVGLLPLEWLARLGPLAASGTGVGDTIRYSLSQMVLLDALLDTLPDADVDATFEKARAELHSFDRIEPADPVEGFGGTLREYQREGLGWLHFLRRFELGGCLADDMGLGKTVQVLALLDARRARAAELPPEERRPSLVVVPRSLVFNWMREAERFTPRIRLLDYSGVGRNVQAIDPANVDLVITTYGTLRRDAALLSAIRFDYAILDEAQAIKNAGSASAKAARLLRADHRLAMTGTPIENRLEELWSLFEFLNPGMLGRSSAFSKLVRLADADSGTGSRDLLAGALRPVILRRTKDQVAQDLPARVEQTLTVELEGAQRKFYDALLHDYRNSVLDRVDRVGIGKARMHILEALLRLRQAACHPVLADPRKVTAPSAKLDALIPTLEEVIAEGHKALVFSQFTTFLALVRTRLDAAGIPYEYLDGRVRNRQARVDRFQNDPACPLFLVSLKAGGQGLNLTAADYVYILDPWWNPAVEAQAIDRAHRIGQTRHVMATRLVARDTIEEKILELQASKRALADAILGQDQGVLSQIGRAELEMLLR
ncbi:MAG TPA: DEAD/DEAH box helicase [Gemmatimonadaceae bacterium]